MEVEVDQSHIGKGRHFRIMSCNDEMSRKAFKVSTSNETSPNIQKIQTDAEMCCLTINDIKKRDRQRIPIMFAADTKIDRQSMLFNIHYNL